MMPEYLRLRFAMWAQMPEYKRRLRLAQGRVSRWLELVANPYIAFSTGKDSTCILHLVRERRSDVPSVYFDADCSYPESYTIMDATPDLIRFATDEPFLDTLERFGFDAGAELERATMQSTVWGPIKRLVAAYHFDGVCYGLRAEENQRTRGRHARTRGAVFQYKRDGLWGCQPIWDWTYNEVWAYIVANNLPYCVVYDHMWDMPEEDQRLSYWAGETKRRYGRWAWLKRNYPELWNEFAARFPEVRSYT